jgi:hypothetical protein
MDSFRDMFASGGGQWSMGRAETPPPMAQCANSQDNK